MRITTASVALVSLVTGAGCAASSADPEQVSRLEQHVESQNALTVNALTKNALTKNALTKNALTKNALTKNSLQYGGEPWNDEFMTAMNEDPEARMFFAYMVSCALPAGESVGLLLDGAEDEEDLTYFYGWHGLAPEWGWDAEQLEADGLTVEIDGQLAVPIWEPEAWEIEEWLQGGGDNPAFDMDRIYRWMANEPVEHKYPGTCDEECQRWVSACMLARTNAYGVSVPLSIRSRSHDVLRPVDALEDEAYRFQEGAFWGNLFAESPQMYACYGPGQNPIQETARKCTRAGADCPMTIVGPCASVFAWSESEGITLIEGHCQPVYNIDPEGWHVAHPRCGGQSGAAYTEVITVFLDARASGELETESDPERDMQLAENRGEVPCGDGVCEGGEGCATCDADCGLCE